MSNHLMQVCLWVQYVVDCLTTSPLSPLAFFFNEISFLARWPFSNVTMQMFAWRQICWCALVVIEDIFFFVWCCAVHRPTIIFVMFFFVNSCYNRVLRCRWMVGKMASRCLGNHTLSYVCYPTIQTKNGICTPRWRDVNTFHCFCMLTLRMSLDILLKHPQR